MRLDEFSVVVFDLDDTLYLERDYVLSGFRAVGDALTREFSWNVAAGKRFTDLCCRLFLDGHRGDIFDRVFKIMSCPGPAIQDLVHRYRTHSPQISLQPDAQALLEQLRRQRVWIITDGPLESQKRKVAALRLQRWTNDVVYTDEWGKAYWKPSPRAFEHVMQSTGATATECVYIADNPTKDFVAPNQLGWKSLRIRRPYGLHAALENPPDSPPNAEINDFSSILPLP